MTATHAFQLSPCFSQNSGYRLRFGGRVLCNLGGGGSTVVSSDKGTGHGAPLVKEDEKIGSSIGGRNGHVVSTVRGRKRSVKVDTLPIEMLWDDGFGTASMKDYLDIAKDMVKPDGGPARWFCPVESGPPLEGSPILLFLPGMDGIGLGLLMHHKTLGRVFEVRCLHIPVYDRTPFEALVEFVGQTVRQEHASSPNKPVYLVGDSFGGCLALAVAAQNPTVDLVVILANPATSLERSQLAPLFPLLEATPDELHWTIPYLLSFVMGEPTKMAMVNVDKKLPPGPMFGQLSENLTALLPRLSVLSDIIPKETLVWKLKLLKSAAAYANSRLHSVTAEVLVLASGKDNMLPSEDEAKRLSSVLKNCIVRTFKENGHTLLLEDGINLLSVIRGICKYRRSRRLDFVTDFVPPSQSEYDVAFGQVTRWLQYCSSPVMFSTLRDGTIVKGLDGVPSEGPVLLVGYHMLMGLELPGLVEGFLREKKVLVRGLAHPELFTLSSAGEFSYFDYMKVFGAIPVTPSNFFKLLATKSHVLLYPGGAREALHRKGEEYTLFWPNQPEFVRMAAKFGATIVPFGTVGEDDVALLALDYDDLVRIPVLGDYIRQKNREAKRVRANMEGEVANENLFIPGLIPKVPGRFYYFFGKPIETQGKEELLSDKGSADELYSYIKSEIESNIGYLLKKREEDPYRSIIDRAFYRLFSAPVQGVPTFSP